MATKFYANKPLNLVGVTGTNGKSSVADFYFQILKLNNKKVASLGTLGVKTHLNNLKVLLSKCWFLKTTERDFFVLFLPPISNLYHQLLAH